MRVTSIQQKYDYQSGRYGRHKDGSKYSETKHSLIYHQNMICEIELISGEKVVFQIKDKIDNIGDVIKNFDFTQKNQLYPVEFQKTMNRLESETMEDVFSKEELENISSILKNPQEEIDRKNKEIDKYEEFLKNKK